jgi:hypothetical protein
MGAIAATAIVCQSWRGFNRAATDAKVGRVDRHLKLSPYAVTLFPGIIFSTAYIAFYVVLGLSALALITVDILVTVPSIRMYLMGYMKWVFFALSLSVVRKVCEVLFNTFLIEKATRGHSWVPYRPVCFSFVYPIMVLCNFPLGILSFIYRSIVVFGCVLVYLVRVDISPLPRKIRFLDFGYSSFLAVVVQGNQQYNLIFQAALTALAPTVYDTWVASSTEDDGKKIEEGRVSVSGDSAKASRLRRLRVRNRLWLAVLLSRNPELASLRRREASADVEEKQRTDSELLLGGALTAAISFRAGHKLVSFEDIYSSSDDGGQ